MTTSQHTLGRNRGALRLWLEGKRLTDCGFAAGSTYALMSLPGNMTLRAMPSGERLRRISGKAGKPVIDITGRDVALAFPMGGKVEVRYDAGFIEVRAYEETLTQIKPSKGRCGGP